MDIDLAALRALERERDLSLEVLIPAIEQALLTAYHRTDGSFKIARVELDRKTGHVVVLAREEGPLLPPTEEGERPTRGEPGPEFDDTPDGFGRVAAATARQVIVQRLRDLEDEAILGDFKGREGDIVSGIVQQGSDPRNVLVDFGTVEGMLPQAEQVPGEVYRHGERLRCYVVSVKRGPKGPQIALSRTHPNLVRSLFKLEVPEIADGTVEIAAMIREAGHRTKIAVRSRVPGVNAKGACIGPMGARVRAVMNELGGEKIDIVDYPTTRASSSRRPCHRRACSRSRSSTRCCVPPGQSYPTTSCHWRSPRRARTPDWPPNSPVGGSTSAPTPPSPRTLRRLMRRLPAPPGRPVTAARSRAAGDGIPARAALDAVALAPVRPARRAG
jgi:N utilization substance protein A